MSRKKLFTLAVLILFLFLLTGCGAGDEEIRLSDSNNGDTVTLKVGQTITISLESNPTTGYTWEVEEIDAAVLAQVGDIEFISESKTDSESEPQLVGQGGTQVLHFQALAAGEFTLKLVYHQPWEGGGVSAEGFSIQVVVSP